MIYYDKDGIRVRNSIKADVRSLKYTMKPSDANEIWASHHHTPEEALTLCLDKSIFCATVENGNPIAMFGIYADNIIGTEASIWMLSSEDLYKIKTRFLRNCKGFIKMMLEYYPYLHNYVDARNLKTIAWLKFLGAEIEEAKSFGVDGLPFNHFIFRKK